MIPVHWWSEHPDTCDNGAMWDQIYIKNVLLAGAIEQGRDEFTTGVIVIPGRFHDSDEDQFKLREYLETRPDTIAVVTSDEECSLRADWLPSKRLWVMTPDLNVKYPQGTRFIGSLFPPHIGEPAEQQTERWFFAGQITHEARRQMAAVLSTRQDGTFLPSEGFTQGLVPKEYSEKMAQAQLHPCPPGAIKPDSFRFYESLELGGIPTLDRNDRDYWVKLFGTLPPVAYTDGWDKIGKAIDSCKLSANQTFAWWQREKRQMDQWLKDDLAFIGLPQPEPTISFMISISPISSHPDTAILDEVIDSIRNRSDAPIYLMFDGVRLEQRKYWERYQQHIRNVLIRYRKHNDIIPIIMPEHHHQAAMTRRVIPMISTPLICFMEQDTPLVGPIDFNVVSQPLLNNEIDMLRLHHEASILPPHEHLMIDHETPEGKFYRRTTQWSQRPHIARTSWYRSFLDTYFGWKSRTMVEDVLHSVVQEAWMNDGMDGWNKFRLAVYTPEDGIDFKRSSHTDGRNGEPKFPMKVAYDGDPPEYAGPPRTNA